MTKMFMFFSMLEKGAPIGFFILDYREEKVCELSYIGLVSGSLGKGLGKISFQNCHSNSMG